MSAPDDLERRRHHRQARPTSHWGKDDPQPHAGPVDRCDECRTPCDAQYGSNPDRCYYPRGHAGPHNNRWGTTWQDGAA